MEIEKELIDKLLADYKKPEDIIGENGLLKQLTKALVERALQAEMTAHLGYEKHSAEGHNSGNSRNGASTKRLKGDFGTVEIAVPRDRQASFDPKMVPKGTTRFAGFDDKILSMYARGMTTREIQGHLEEMYQVEVSPDTDFERDRCGDRGGEGLAEPAAGCGLSDCLPGCAGGEDAERGTGGEPGDLCGYRHQPGRAEGSAGLVDLGQRRSEVLAAGADRAAESRCEGHLHRLRGWAEGISAGDRDGVSEDHVQLCIVHLVRASLNYVNWKERKLVAQELKSIYRAATLEHAERELASFTERWDKRYPSISALWRRNWQGVIPFFQFPHEIRKIVYTTNAIESLNMSLRKAIKTRGAFPAEDAALKVMYLALRNLAMKWNAVQGWKEALNRFGLLWEARFPQ